MEEGFLSKNKKRGERRFYLRKEKSKKIIKPLFVPMKEEDEELSLEELKEQYNLGNREILEEI